MLALLLAALIGGQEPQAGEVNPPAPATIPAADAAAMSDAVPAPIVPRATLLDAHPAPPPAAEAAPRTSSPAAERSDRSYGAIYLRPSPELVALLTQRTENENEAARRLALSLPVQPIAPPPAAPAPPKPSPQSQAVTASPQVQAETAAPVATVPVQQVSAVVQPGPIRRALGATGEAIAHLGQPRVYYARQPRQRYMRVPVAAPVVNYVPVAAPVAPAVQPLTAPSKGGY